jgi:hypothetical protein
MHQLGVTGLQNVRKIDGAAPARRCSCDMIWLTSTDATSRARSPPGAYHSRLTVQGMELVRTEDTGT